MADSGMQWFKGCAAGCGGLLLLGVLGVAAMTFSLRSAFQDAHHDRQAIEKRFGGRETYTPSPDGALAADRIEAFLEVREALAPIRAELEGVEDEVAELDELDRDGDPKMTEALPVVAGLTRTMLGLPWVFGDIERTRNRALLDAGMGMGEYTYIYFVAYHREIVTPQESAQMFSGSAVNGRVRDELVGDLRRQLDGARALLGDADPIVTALEAEIAALAEDPQRLPWQDGLPPSVADSLAPYRLRLDAAYSVASAEFELLNSDVKRGGLTIVMD